MPDLYEPYNDRKGPDETERDRLRRIISPEGLSVNLVSAFAGDRPLTGEEQALIRRLQEARGELFYSDCLYTVTHRYFPPEVSRNLWDEILLHKYGMSMTLKRNVQIIVATLDFLTNHLGDPTLPTLVNEEQIAEIVSMSMRDGLTGLFNHTTFYEMLGMQLKGYARHYRPVSLILADIDDFKQVNDQYGHQTGDRLLKELADALVHTTRQTDICCRYGGEEFAIILPATGLGGAVEIAEKTREAARQVRSADRGVTISLGCASCEGGTPDPNALVKKADQALYQAKKTGKNRVCAL